MTTNPVGSEPPRLRGRPPNRNRDREILRIAQEIIADRGVSAVTMDEVSVRAGASKATLYRRWPNRVALVEAAAAAFQWDDRVPDTGNLVDDLNELMRSWNMPEGFDAGAVEKIIRSVVHSQPAWAAFHSATARTREDALAVVVERAVARGEALPGRNVALLNRIAQAMVADAIVLRGEAMTDAVLAEIVECILVPLLTGVHQPEIDGSPVGGEPPSRPSPGGGRARHM
ncbi:TetR/AcrR family transcriptional regulator [Rhodococcus opacus]|uniref:TetR/AcrR family transcriptional regulator n=1 Tax=Rhodococcus opacus TaxID=37919 RepID=UPI000FFC3C4B|nr:TetR/AcrR family transcriptional regulator [Rhodococcus opacus]